MNNYYVYVYWRLDTNEIFYVGKGKGYRWRRLDRSNKHFNNIINKHPIMVEIIKDNLTEEQAHGVECWLINELVFEYGYSIDIPNNRSNEKSYHLTNATWGGDGTSGWCPNEELRKQISERQKLRIGDKNSNYGNGDKIKGENNPFYGKKHTEISKKRMSENHADFNGKNHPNATSVICLTTKKIFFTIKEGAEYYGIKSQTDVMDCCKGFRIKKEKVYKVRSAGRLSDGTKLVWKKINWRHNKKYRIKGVNIL